MAKIEQKATVIDEIKANIQDAKSVVLVDHRGLTVEQDTQLRKSLRDQSIVYKVYKNTLMKLAFEGTEFEALSKHLDGPSAIAISKTDATAPARILNNTAKTVPALEFKAGVVEGEYYDAKNIVAIADIPSKEVLLSKLFGSIKSPIGNFARVIKQIAEQKAEPQA